jgi:predicted  nucleic acid-binding Zn-ribbon protein
MKVYKQERDFNKEKEVELLYRCQNLFKEKKELLAKLVSELSEVFARLEELEGRVAVIEEKKALIDKDLSTLDEEALDAFAGPLEDYDQTVTAMSRDVNRLVKRIGEIGAESRRLNEQMDTLNNDYQRHNYNVGQKMQAMVTALAPTIDQLKEMAPEIPEALFAHYKKLRASKKMPAFVPYTEDGNCFACGMNISIEVGDKLQTPGALAECPHCRRVVYKA